jgi:type II secretory pathway pseudopilin PulG
MISKKGNGCRRNTGFTVIEFLLVIITIFILAAIALPQFISGQDNAREAAVRLNMRTCQIAAESYANDAGGIYPPSSNDPGFRSYFTGGNSNYQAPNGRGIYPTNPFTKQPEQPEPLKIVGTVELMRTSPRPQNLGLPGQVLYAPIADPNGAGYTSYAIEGVGKSGAALAGAEKNTTQVLSNQ